ncbi:hypothetical protein BSKO_12398 [Bryopsis sp. KO-2023]|nr:hypothetical protein BSKO_12398 [Bryopsis sp. KO-2023]
MKPAPLYCKVSYSLLAICYLEVVLWTSCLLLTSFAGVPGEVEDTQNYLLRETVNLKCVGSANQALYDDLEHSRPLPRYKDLEPVCAVQRTQHLNTVRPVLVQQSFVGINNLPVQQGLPAPFTGVAALS